MSNRASSEARFEITSVVAVAEADRATALEKLRDFLDDHRVKLKTGPGAFEDFERELQARVMEFQREVVAAEMRAVDIDEAGPCDAVDSSASAEQRPDDLGSTITQDRR